MDRETVKGWDDGAVLSLLMIEVDRVTVDSPTIDECERLALRVDSDQLYTKLRGHSNLLTKKTSVPTSCMVNRLDSPLLCFFVHCFTELTVEEKGFSIYHFRTVNN